METVVRNVRDLPQTERSVLEGIVGQTLRESQQIVIQVTNAANEPAPAAEPVGDQLLPWCDVYEGLTDAEIDELDRAIVRDHSSRDIT